MPHPEPPSPAATPRRFSWQRLVQYRLRKLPAQTAHGSGQRIGWVTYIIAATVALVIVFGNLYATTIRQGRFGSDCEEERWYGSPNTYLHLKWETHNGPPKPPVFPPVDTMQLIVSDWYVGALVANFGFLASVIGLVVFGVEALRWRQFTLRRLFVAITLVAILMATIYHQ